MREGAEKDRRLDRFERQRVQAERERAEEERARRCAERNWSACRRELDDLRANARGDVSTRFLKS